MSRFKHSMASASDLYMTTERLDMCSVSDHELPGGGPMCSGIYIPGVFCTHHILIKHLQPD